jgi:hypothetical protein
MNKTTHSACVVLLPDNQDGSNYMQMIQDIRKQYDKSFERWPVHLFVKNVSFCDSSNCSHTQYACFYCFRNLLYPFIDSSLFEENIEKINAILRDTEPFEMTMSDFGENARMLACCSWLKEQKNLYSRFI